MKSITVAAGRQPSRSLSLPGNQTTDRTFLELYTSFCMAAPTLYRPQSVFNKLAPTLYW